MSIIAIGMNLLLACLISAGLVVGLRLNARLKALRDSHDGFAKAVAELDAAAQRAEQGLADLRAATDEAHDALADRIEKARALTAKLDRQLMAAPRAQRPEPVRPEPARPELVRAEPRREPPRPSLARHEDPLDELELGEDVARVTQRLGSLLSGAREVRPDRERLARREALAQRLRVRQDDELFDAGLEREPLRAGARR